jgi:hypothetical protein
MDNVNKERRPSEIFFERFRCTPKTDKELEWWADQLIEWAHKEDSLVLMGFAAENLIDQARLHEWAKRCPKLERAIKVAKGLLGARREHLALHNKINAVLVMKTMANYNDDYHAYEKEMKLLGSEEEKRAQTINVIMPKMPSTDVVPKKKKFKKDE